MTGTEPAEPSDLDLVRLAQAGDLDAFGELVERNRRAVFRAALAAVGIAAEADDVAQETFVTAFRKLDGFRGESAFKTWLLSIAWRKAHRSPEEPDALDPAGRARRRRSTTRSGRRRSSVSRRRTAAGRRAGGGRLQRVWSGG